MRAPAVNRARLAGILLLASAMAGAAVPAPATKATPGTAPTPVPVATPDGVVFYPGMASDLESGRPVYAEQHYVRYQSGRAVERVVLYACTNGAAFARKVLRYADAGAPGNTSAHTSATAWAPDFELLDGRQGQHSGVRPGAGEREVYYREKSGARETRAAAPGGSGWVADAGFDEFVRANWTRLMHGEALPLEFLIPSRLGLHRFQVKRLRSEVLGGVQAQVIRLRLSGWLGFILPHIDAWYSDPGHVLLRYEGLSNLMDADGDHYKVRIVFPQEQRATADDAAMSAARAAPLRSCG